MNNHKPLILIVEDEEDMQGNLKDLLGKEYDLIFAGTGEEAITKYELNQSNLNIVLLDIRLPDMYGIVVLRKMKNINLRPDIIMVTALKDVELAVNTMKFGAYDYICKPFFAEDILQTIKRALEKEDYTRKLANLADRIKKETICAERRRILMQEVRMQRKLENRELSPEEDVADQLPVDEQDYDLTELKNRLEKDLGHPVTISPDEPKKSILVVEDEADMRENLKDTLSPIYEFSAASTGQEALACLSNAKFDVILLDIRLPDIHGIKLLEKIRVIDPQASVIMVTALKDVETAIAAMKGGAYDYVTKPFFQADLLATIDKALQHHDYKNILTSLLKKLNEEKLSYAGRLKMLKEFIARRRAGKEKVSLGDVFCFFPEYAGQDLYSEVELPDFPPNLTLEDFLERLKNRKENRTEEAF